MARKTRRPAKSGCVHPPSNCPWTRPATHLERYVDTTCRFVDQRNEVYEIFLLTTLRLTSLSMVGARLSRAALGEGGQLLLLLIALVLLFPRLFPRPLPGQRRFHALFLSRLQVKGVPLDLLNDVFLLHLALEAPQCIFEGFSLLQPYLGQTNTPPDSSCRNWIVITRF